MSKSKNVDRFLKSFGEEVVKRAKKNLVAAGKGGGKLERSIKSKIVKFTKGFILQWEMANYGEFQDKGVKGKGGKIGKKSIGGRRYYTTWENKRKDSPYKFGRGTGKKGGLRKGIASFIRKKGLQPRSKGGQYISTKSLIFMFSRSVYIRGIHGVSFFQNSLMWGMKTFSKRYASAIAKDIADNLRDGEKK